MKFRKMRTGIAIGATLLGLQLVTENQSADASSKVNFKAVNPNKQQTIVLGLKGKNNKQLDRFIYQTVTPGNNNYRKYLTPKQFGQQYGLTNQKMKVVGKYLQQRHLKFTTYPGNIVMNVTGKTKDIEKVFKLKIKQSTNQKDNYQTTNDKYYLDKTLAKYVSYVDQDSLKQNYGKTPTMQVNDDNSQTASLAKLKDPNLTDRSYRKFGRIYNTTSLYDAHHEGQKQTIGIMANADFNMDDIKQYLKSQGVERDLGQINKIYVDNDISKDSGDQSEVTMDVEQASVMAPKAKINVYIGNNVYNNDYVTAYATAIGRDNVAVLSNSYGINENDYAKNSKDFGEFQLLNRLFKQAAAQGITSFNASGDNGAYNFPSGNKPSVGFPVASPYITAVGGTTLPFNDLRFSTINNLNPNFKLNDDKTVSLTHETAWSQTTLAGLFGQAYINQVKDQYTQYLLGQAQNDAVKQLIQKQLNAANQETLADKLSNLAGSGGGFSSYFALPKYQKGVSGVGTYNARSYVNLKDGSINYDAPLTTGQRSGRNVPDISGNADPLTGYSAYFDGKSDPFGGNGTSVVTPQMAGMAAVINSAQGERMGFWNPQIYRFAQMKQSPFTPLNSADNNNLYYTGQSGKLYNQATGLGTVNFTKLNQAFTDAK